MWVDLVLETLGKPRSLIEYVTDRWATTAATPSIPPRSAGNSTGNRSTRRGMASAKPSNGISITARGGNRSCQMKIAILGSRGRLGAALIRKWSKTHEVRGFARPEIDFLDPATIDRCLDESFDWVVNCIAQANVDACERQPEGGPAGQHHRAAPGGGALRENGRALHPPQHGLCVRRPPARALRRGLLAQPAEHLRQSKADGEFAVLAALPEAIVARVAWIFGPEKPSFVDMLLSRAFGQKKVSAITDKWSTPTYTEDLADWLEMLIQAEAPGGIYHLCNAGSCTWRSMESMPCSAPPSRVCRSRRRRSPRSS